MYRIILSKPAPTPILMNNRFAVAVHLGTSPERGPGAYVGHNMTTPPYTKRTSFGISGREVHSWDYLKVTKVPLQRESTVDNIHIPTVNDKPNA